MDKKQIEKEAEEYVADINDKILNTYPKYIRPQVFPVYSDNDLADAFEAGSEWRINSVWHSNTEMPSIGIDEYGSGKDCVVQPKYGVIEIGEAVFDEGIYAISCNREIYTMDEIERWAYVEDLLPIKETEK